MSWNIEVESGSSVRLPTAGKYCDRDVVITALGGGGTGGNFKKKFVSLSRQKNRTYGYDFLVTFCGSIAGDSGFLCYDEEILPTKTFDGIKVSSFTSSLHLYFIEDENDICIYGDLDETGTNKWFPLSTMMGVEFGGVITDMNDIDIKQMAVGAPYVFIYYEEVKE